MAYTRYRNGPPTSLRLPKNAGVVRICVTALMEALRVELFSERARMRANAINALQ